MNETDHSTIIKRTGNGPAGHKTVLPACIGDYLRHPYPMKKDMWK
jgi:hypothetical protein